MVASNVHALDTVNKDVKCYKNNQTIKKMSTVADNYRQLKKKINKVIHRQLN